MRSFCACPLRKRAETPRLLSGFRNPPYLFLSLLSYQSTFLCLYRQQIQTECVIIIYVIFKGCWQGNDLCTSIVFSFCKSVSSVLRTVASAIPRSAHLLQYHLPCRSTRSSATASQLFSVPWHSLSLGSRAFCFSYLCTKNMELLIFSHSAVSNTVFI